MAPVLRKLLYVEAVINYKKSSFLSEKEKEKKVVWDGDKKKDDERLRLVVKRRKDWRCVDWCCWLIGYICTAWWLLLFLYNTLPSHYLQLPVEPPGLKLKKEGLRELHPVVFVPGIVTGGLELWEGRPCAHGLFRKRVWGGSFTEIFKRPLCWLEHMSLDNETGLDPPGIRVRPVPGLVAADYFGPGYFVWAVLIENLAHIGYEGKNMHMTSYDWRLSFQNTEVRDQSLSRLKSKIELMVRTNGHKVVVVPHSMGVLYFLHFIKWVEAPTPMGGGGGPHWCHNHIKAVMNIGPAFLGVPKALSGIFSAEAKDIAFARAMAPYVLDSDILGLQTLGHIMRVSRTWDSIMSLLPKGGETIWGDLDWSPEEGYCCNSLKDCSKAYVNQQSGSGNSSNGKLDATRNEKVHYGRIISFGKLSSQLPSSILERPDSKVVLFGLNSPTGRNSSCGGEVWTEYHEMSKESIRAVAEGKAYTSGNIVDLLRFVAPRLMRRADSQFSHGIADDLDHPTYNHYRYWSNPLETKLPNAPEMEMYCLYGVGIPTERSYVYKDSPSDKCSIPFKIDSGASGGGGCLKGGVYLVDGDESVPVLSAGFMCAKGWRGKNRFNPEGMPTHVREYRHLPPTNLLEGRGMQSGAHVDIMGNVALIEDIMRVAAGATGRDIGGDRIYSQILQFSERINLPL
ncbi:hypothetical protein AMTR_s00040p00234940 [Amborella trichopoda]|uniref:phospholipid:diacylglycerol acyltransferase n=2 Tax=Amborella trichopoda TaxID=13333 RepID=W1PY99_AMBTC|nr:hypothetical protein AMTR_s00040p00234940 [Amborella trichopoda]